MSDGRSNRKTKVVPFVDRLERDRNENLKSLVSKAKLMKLVGFESVVWDDPEWQVEAGRLVKLTGKNTKSASFGFSLSPKLGAESLDGCWELAAKALFVLRFHRKHQSTPNQRNFITAIGYVSFAAKQIGQELARLTPESLDNACVLISKHYSDTTAYNLHKHVAEFAAHCDANGLCRVLLQYKYAKMKRPASTGGISHKRLDDPVVLETKSDKLVDPAVFRVIGELYSKVPKDHKYRFYILMLTLLVCTGRRFSEISLLPNQQLSFDDEGNRYIEYFPRKASRGDAFTPKRRLYLPSEVTLIVRDVLVELEEITYQARSTAEEMHKVGGPDIRFLDTIQEGEKLYAADLKELGISHTVLGATGWLRKRNLTWPDHSALTKRGIKPANPIFFTYKSGLVEYCCRNCSEEYLSAFHTDQFGKEYYLQDLLFIRPLGLSSGSYAHWMATSCTQSMFTTFLRYFPELAAEYASSRIEVDFTSHHFRHTLNTLLDEGGLSDLLQTEWFGRTNPRDTKAYQHTSREKRALMLREDIKKGLVGGLLVEQIKVIPLEVQDAILKARIQAVHDVGTGICIHNFSQTPCERHLQCSADCKDYVWVKDDKGRLDDQKRQYAMAALARKNAEKQLISNKPKKSADWLAHNDKKLKTLAVQLADNGVEHFDPEKYLNEVEHG
ncbi:integrase [Tatumella citrea]|uniref:Integrase n=1 Tax=Tatumella citrea TaxID=53336 RepID=A0A1Y0LNC3_TATCI|nr:integrase [Tatumella citrea]ARU95475.1 integrase [Tatumella citrea]ARU99516.1 integrase [Tatumella citrea]